MSNVYLALPDEVVVETILWRLPVKSIIQCRCVCKSWYSLITSRNFISTHLRKTLTKNPQLFVHQKISDDGAKNKLLFDSQDYFHSILFRFDLSHTNPIIEVVGSISGLICFSIARGGVWSNTSLNLVNLVICNPKIGHFQSIPQPYPSERTWMIKGFGFDERTLDYNILLIASGEIGFIYSLNSNCWRSIPKDPKFSMYGSRRGRILFVNGMFYWLVLSGGSYFIAVFDLKSEAFGRISLPSECLLERGRAFVDCLMEYGESSIAISCEVMHTKSMCIWIMEEYGSIKSWKKIELSYYPQGVVVGFRNKVEVLRLSRSGRIFSQKINKKKVDKLTDEYKHPSLRYSSGFYKTYRYVPSLVLLDKENNVDVSAPTHTILDIAAAPTRRERDKAAAPTRKK